MADDHVNLPSGLASRPRPPPNRRRDKLQLSCSICRRRKLKCDRKRPCSTCAKSGDELSCTYVEHATSSSSSKRSHFPMPSVTNQNQPNDAAPVYQRVAAQGPATAVRTMPTPLAPGSLNLNRSGTWYRERFHWASVLDDIAELKTQPEVQHASQTLEETTPEVTDTPPSTICRSVLLLHGCKHLTKEELLAAVPPRPVADRLTAHYFSAWEFSLAILQKGEFLKQYNKFWEDPAGAPISWLGLLFSVFCLATQFSNSDIRITNESQSSQPAQSFHLNPRALIQGYREKIVQSLVLAQFSKGGSYIVETLIHYVVVEEYLRRDSNIGIWLVLGNLVQVAILMGYHRDPSHFKNLSVYQGEMRRRIWATIYHMDVSASTKLGMPRIIKDSITDALEPRNLLDSDFDASSTVLPPSRSEEELTPVLPLIFKSRISSVSSTVADLNTDPRSYTYAETMKVDAKLNGVIANMPEPCKLQPLSQSIMDSPKVICQQMYIQLLYHKTQIFLHQRYLGLPGDPNQWAYSRKITLEAATQILRYQHVMDEESKPTGRFESIKWIFSSLINHEFLLATSVLCFYVQQRKRDMTATGLEEIETLLRKTQAIWDRDTATSIEASKASAALNMVLKNLGRSSSSAEKHSDVSVVTPGVPSELDFYPSCQDYSWGLPIPSSFFNSMLQDPSLVSMGPDDTDYVLATSSTGSAWYP